MNALQLPESLHFISKEINSDEDFVSIVCQEHGLFYKKVTEIKRGNKKCPHCQFLNPSRMFDILEKAQYEIKFMIEDGVEWLDFYYKNRHQPEIFEARSLYYRLHIVHKETGFQFEKIGILSNLDEKSEGDFRLDFEKLWNPYKWGAFKIEPIDKIECTLLEAYTIEALYQQQNTKNKITIPNELGFNTNKTYLPHFITQARSKTIKPLRDAILNKQKGKCTICGKPVQDPTLDHEHIKKVKGTGFIRAVCCSRCNTFIARAENNAARHGISLRDLPDVLRNMANHLENQIDIIHPTEIPKRKKVGLREWNRIKKYYFKAFPNRRTLPKKPTYVTEAWLDLKRVIDNYIEEQNVIKKNKRTKNDRAKN